MLAGPHGVPPDFMQTFDLEEVDDIPSPEAHPMADSTIYAKLIAVQTSLKAPKNQYNSFGGYNYRSCEDILEAVKPLLAEQGLTLYLFDDVENVGSHNYVKASAVVVNADGDHVRATAYAREADEKKGMDPSQMTGTASSYARKYALNGLFLIDDTKDADTDEGTQQRQQEVHQEYTQQRSQPREQAPPPRQQRAAPQQQGNGGGYSGPQRGIGEGGPASDAQKNAIHKMAGKARTDVDKLLYDETNGQEVWDDMSKGTASHLIDLLKTILDG